jgi:hypothetical protein
LERAVLVNTLFPVVQDTEEEFTKFLKNVEDLSPKLQDAAKVMGAMALIRGSG